MTNIILILILAVLCLAFYIEVMKVESSERITAISASIAGVAALYITCVLLHG